jgi:threonine dehydratase
MALEIVEAAPDLDAMIIAVGGGSQAVGALTVARALRPALRVYAVQATGAAAMHDAVQSGQPRTWPRADTFADGIATRAPYELTYPALREGLAGFVTVTDAEIAAAMRTLLSTTHQLVEGAGAAGLAGLGKLRSELSGRRVAIVLSGGNVDLPTLRRVVTSDL